MQLLQKKQRLRSNMSPVKLVIVSLAFMLFSGCLARSQYVDDLRMDVTDLSAIVSKHHPEDDNLKQLIQESLQKEIEGSGLINKSTMAGAIKTAGQVGNIMGIPMSGWITGLLSLLTAGGVAKTNSNRKKDIRKISSS